MKHLLLFLAALVAMPPAVAGDYMSLRLMTYNVHNCIGTDRQTDIERIAAIVRRQAPDVVAVQEVDSATQRNGGRYVLGELASLTGMHANFARAIDFQGGAYGIGVLSKRKPLSCTMCPLPGREEERALLVVEFPEFFFACTHLSLTETDRMGALATIERMASGSSKPFFIAGDLNANPADGFMSAFGQSFNVLSDRAHLSSNRTGSDHRLHSRRQAACSRGKNRETAGTSRASRLRPPPHSGGYSYPLNSHIRERVG